MQFFYNSNSGKEGTHADPEQLAPFIMTVSLCGIRRWLANNKTPLEPCQWTFTDDRYELMCREDPTSVELIDRLLGMGWVRVVVSDNPDHMGSTLSKDDCSVIETGSNRNIYSLVEFKARMEWSGGIPMTKQRTYYGDKLQIRRNHDVRMGKDGLGCYWGEYALNHGVSVRITYLANNTNASLHDLVLDHQQDPAELPEDVLGFRFLSVNIPVTNQAIAPILGSTHGEWFVAGAQMKGGFQINSKVALNLKMESVCVASMRSCDPPLDMDGYINFFDEASKFTCLYEVSVNGRLVLATLGNETHHRNST
jgi:hypothetical protein